MLDDQALQPLRRDLIDDGRSWFRRSLAHRRERHADHGTVLTLVDVRQHLLHSPDVVGSVALPFAASRKMSRSSTSSPTFCLSFLMIRSSLNASSSFGRAPAHSPPPPGS